MITITWDLDCFSVEKKDLVLKVFFFSFLKRNNFVDIFVSSSFLVDTQCFRNIHPCFKSFSLSKNVLVPYANLKVSLMLFRFPL